MSAEWAAFLISLLSLGFSVLAAAVANRAADRSNALQARIVELEEARERDRQAEAIECRLGCRIQVKRHGGLANYLLWITNSGPGTAYRIRPLLDGTPWEALPSVVNPITEVAALPPGGRVMSTITDTMAIEDRIYDVELRWRNERGEECTTRIAVTPE